MLKNKCKTLLLMTALASLLMLLGSCVGGTEGITAALVMALICNGIMYFFSDRIVLSLYGAQPLNAEKYPFIVSTVAELAEAMHLPMPRLWIINTSAANAFATGRNPRHSSIAFTEGIITLLEPHELRGVIAHELSHIYHQDILITTIASIIAAAIGYVAHYMHNIFLFSHDRRNKHSSFLGSLLIAIIMPFIATLIRLSISRSREYLADEQGAYASHDPLALASALQKLHSQTTGATHEKSAETVFHAATASLFIVCPASCSTTILELFSTHPPVQKRIAALQRVYAKQHGL